MPSSPKYDPRIPGPATKPVVQSLSQPDPDPMADPVLDPMPGGNPIDDGPSLSDGRGSDPRTFDDRPRDLVDETGEPITPSTPLSNDDPWARADTAPEPLGVSGEAAFWDDEAATSVYDDVNDDDGDTGGDDSWLAQGADMIRRNPVGAGLLVAGIALLASPRLERDTVRRGYDDAREYGRDRLTQGRAQFDTASRHLDAHREDAKARFDTLRARISDGTEGMSDQAKERVMAARQRALDASDQASRGLRKGAARADDALRANPLVAGALVLAASAAIGAALPRTKMEDSRLGRMSDRLMTEAQSVFEEERARIMAGASAAADEMRGMARDMAQETRDAMPDGAQAVERGKAVLQDGVSRVATAARDAADSKPGGKKDGKAGHGKAT